MQSFLSCDWGTSSFRLRVVAVNGSVTHSVENKNQGIADTYRSWKETNESEDQRLNFFRNILSGSIDTLQQRSGSSLSGLPLIISGMASSSIGMLPLEYKSVPISADGSDLIVKRIPGNPEFAQDILVISGVRNHNDVMRGEETQLIGAMTQEEADVLYIFPGTHSKHVVVNKERVVDLKTYMTGEVFALLAHNSVLANSIEVGNGIAEKKNAESFEAGVMTATKENFLHAVFTVRTNSLLEKLSAEENYYYLSGLLIGSELKTLQDGNHKIVLVASEAIQPFYVAALQLLNSYSEQLEIIDADKALLTGQKKIGNHYFS